jgi:hypothetical protein
VYQMLTILAMACAGSEQSIVLDLAMPVSPVRVKAEQISVTVRNVPPNWSLQTKVVIAPAPDLSMDHLPQSPVSPVSPIKSMGASDTSAAVPRCRLRFDSASIAGAVKSATDIFRACSEADKDYALAKAFRDDYSHLLGAMNDFIKQIDEAASPTEVAKTKRDIRSALAQNARWGNLLRQVVDTFTNRADTATTRRFECSLDWNDSAIVTASNQAAEQTKAKRIDIAIVRWRKTKSLKGVSIGVSYFKHDVNNFTVLHSNDTSATQSRIENRPEEGGSLQPSLMVFLPFAERGEWELGVVLGYTPKIDLSSVRIFDASLSAGIAAGTSPFGFNVSVGVTPLAHLKGGYKTGQVYDGDLDAANVTQNTFTFMYGGGIFWSFN